MEAIHVVLDSIAVGELQAAVLARVRFDAAVDTAVNLQVVLGVEPFVALFTAVGSIVGVDAVVAFQAILCPVLVPALITLVLRVLMHQFVQLQAGFRFKLLAADLTTVHRNGIVRLQVSPQVLVLLSTDVTKAVVGFRKFQFTLG